MRHPGYSAPTGPGLHESGPISRKCVQPQISEMVVFGEPTICDLIFATHKAAVFIPPVQSQRPGTSLTEKFGKAEPCHTARLIFPVELSMPLCRSVWADSSAPRWSCCAPSSWVDHAVQDSQMAVEFPSFHV